jgi:hypothetical protein
VTGIVDEFRNYTEKTVWENSNGTHLMTVTGLLETGEYNVEKEVREDDTTILEFHPQETGSQ